MKMRYDKSVDALYIPLKKGKYSHSEKITEDIIVDVTKEGDAIGIEILDASENIAGFRPNKIDISFAKLVSAV